MKIDRIFRIYRMRKKKINPVNLVNPVYCQRRTQVMLRIKNRLIIYLLGAALLAPSFSVHAQTPYQKPPKTVLDVLDAPESATVSVSPSRDKMLLSTPVRYPSIAELAEPMLRLAGSRINPKTNGPHNPRRII